MVSIMPPEEYMPAAQKQPKLEADHRDNRDKRIFKRMLYDNNFFSKPF